MSSKNTSIKISISLHSKIAKLYKVNEKQRPFVASSSYKTEASFLLEQIACQEKAIKKLTAWPINKLFFTQLALEQSTSLTVAQEKAKIIGAFSSQKNNILYSLTGGLGVDDSCLALYFEHVISIDPNSFLNEIMEYNLKELSIDNITRKTETAEIFLAENNIQNSIIYLDPDRRAGIRHNNKNVSSFAPNIFEIIPELIKGSNLIFIKLSGATDITWIEKQLQPVHVYVFSQNKEVKEILVLIDGFKKLSTMSFVSITEDGSNKYEENDLIILQNITSPSPTDYILKLDGLFTKSKLLRKNLKPISENTFLYFLKNKEVSEYGKILKIDWSFEGSLKQLDSKLKKANINRASVLTKNWKLNSAQTKQRLNLLESKETQLLIFGKGKNIMAFFCTFE